MKKYVMLIMMLIIWLIFAACNNAEQKIITDEEDIKTIIDTLSSVQIKGDASYVFHVQAETTSTQPPSDTISILFTHDMHSHLDPQRDAGTGAERGGFARLKTAIDAVKQQYPHSFVLDAGDFAMGTPYQTIFSSEAAELRLMGRLGYDATTLGNHEFDYRSKGLSDMLESALDSGEKIPPVLIANIDWEKTLADPQRAGDAARLKPLLERAGNQDYMIIEKGGVKAAVFGIMGKEADSYAPESGLYFKDQIKTAREVVAQIKADGDADLIICLSHSGTNVESEKSEDQLLAANVHEIDVIISGHTHTKLDRPIMSYKTWIVSAGEYTDYLGHLTVKKENNGYWQNSYELIPIDGEIEKDEAIEADILRFRELVDTHYLLGFGYSYSQLLAATDFGFTPIDQFGDVQGEEPLGSLIADSYVSAIKRIEGDAYRSVDVAVVPEGVVRSSFAPGDITVADAFNVSSLGVGPDQVPGYPLVSLYLTGKELKTLAEIDISVSALMPEARLYMSGLSYTHNPHRLLLNRVTDVKLAREAGVVESLEDTRLYRVVGGLYSCQMMGAVEAKSLGLLKIAPKDENGEPITDFEQHIVYDGDHEMKEWVALAWYLESFEKDEGGVPQISSYYNETHGRKVEIKSLSPVELLKNPNKIFFLLVGLTTVFLVLMTLMIVPIVREARRRARARR